MGTYAKTAPGERLTYRPANLSQYEGEPFCLRITPEDIDLERCFFVYLDETCEDISIRRLFDTYFINPKPDHVDEIEARLERWLRVDPMLSKKYALIRNLIARTRAQSGNVLFYINHGPGPINIDDTVRNHLGTSVFADGSFDDKILDLVLEFHAGDDPLPELEQWAHFQRTDTSGTTGPTARVKRRRFLSGLVMTLIALVTFPLMFFSCRRNNFGGGGGGGGFGGGML